MTEAGKSLYRDAKYLIQYSREVLERAKSSMENQEEVISIGVSPVTPAQIFMDLWPKIQQYCPELKLKIVPFENTPENAREILGNLGQGIDVVVEPFCCAVSLHHPLAG